MGPAPTPIWIIDDGRIVFANQAAVKLLGGTRAEDFLSRSPFDFIHPRYHNLVRQRVAALFATGQPLPVVEEEFCPLQGPPVPVLVTSIPFSWKGRPTQQVHFTDLRPVRQAQQIAQASRAQLDLVTDKIPALVSYLDRDLRYVSANHAYVRWTGLPAAQIIGKHVNEIVSKHIAPDEWDRVDASLQGCLKGESHSLVLHGSYNSQDRIVQAYYSPDMGASGDVKGVIVLVVDITEQRRAEQELHLRATLLEEALEPIFAWRLPGPITYWNRAAEEVYGYSQDEAMDRSSHELLQTRAQIPIERVEAILEQDGFWQGQLEHQTKTGEHLIVDARLRSLRSEGVVYVIECTRDVTQRVRAEEDLRRLAATLESRVQERTEALTQANEDLEAYGYTISHDLRAPLRTMQGFANALIEDYADSLDTLGTRYLQRIGAAAERMDELINDLLEYSRLGRSNLRLERVDLNRVLEDVLAQHQASIARTQAHITIAPGLPAVRGHYVTLVQVVGNLLSNALKFHRPSVPPDISIAAECQSGRVRLFVTDAGIGIEPEHQGRVFRVFERLHGQESYPGTGIGLAIVKRGVERLGGTVGLTSEPNKGTTFIVEMPCAPSV